MGPHDPDIMVTECLNCENWKAWSYEMESLLDDKDLLDNIKVAPAQKRKQQQEEEEQGEVDSEDDCEGDGGGWKRRDEMARMLLLINCGPDAKAAMDGKETAFEMWNALKLLCQAETARHAFAALQEAILCRQARSEPVADHIAKMEALFAHVEDGGLGFSEVQRIGILLGSLSPKFDSARRECALADPAMLRWDDVARQLIVDEEVNGDVLDDAVDEVVNLMDF